MPGVGVFPATLINAGIPTIFVKASDIGYSGAELQDAINADPTALTRLETIRAHGALKMGLIKTLDEIASRQHTPKLAFVAPPLTTSRPAASRCAPPTSTSWRGPCPWASCTTR